MELIVIDAPSPFKALDKSAITMNWMQHMMMPHNEITSRVKAVGEVRKATIHRTFLCISWSLLSEVASQRARVD